MNPNTRRLSLALACLYVLTTAACSLPTRQMAQITYRLQAEPAPQILATTPPQSQAEAQIVAQPAVPHGAQPGSQPVVIRLLPLGVAPGLGSPAMLYSPLPGQLMPYRDSRWLATPAELVRAAIAQTLSRQPWVSAVEQGTPLAPATWTLHCDLTRLEQDLHGSQGVVHMDLSCQLVQTDTRRLAAHWQMDGAQAIDVNDAAHYAAAAQTLLNTALQTLVERVGATVLQPKAP